MTTATRVFISVSRKSSHYDSAWDSPNPVVRFALQVVKDCNLLSYNKLPTPRLLAKERWQRIHIVFDIFNDSYDPKTAHLAGQNDLPVVAVYLGGTDKASIAPSPLKEEVNKSIRNLHDWNGNESQAPFVVDHAKGNVPTYPNPRLMVGFPQSTVLSLDISQSHAEYLSIRQ
ncbi:hypothetical protein MKZ38_000946 [Zalerion maritima]|uniref:Uncharacterized protein n=1 Tax=Zalerion maritima TaxID=339359 RepID=A0AAD5RFG2_9PEZI|nr:hypothetical protein MKZ38_000946 [Zalerion maritima]